MFAAGPVPACKVCGMLFSDNRFKHDPSTGGPLYWINPKLWKLSIPEGETPVFCGAEHATRWTVEEMAAARNGEAGQLLDQP